MNIALLLSGGVDSSVALRLLQEQGHTVTAFYLKIWLEDELAFLGECPWEEDLRYARAVCEQANVPLEILSMQREYFEKVVSYTIDEVKHGRTPNPDIMCNNQVKFGLFLDKIQSKFGPDHFDKVASGHYAQIVQKNSTYYLRRSPDPIKDQTYFLARLSQKQLSKIEFPIGHLHKSEVRELAQKYNLPNKDRKDSQGICFLGKFKYNEFLNHYLGEKKGDLIEFETNKKLGEHNGFWYFTIGQRSGIMLSGGPWFVVKKDTDANIVYISKTYYEPTKARDTFTITDFNWFDGLTRTAKNFGDGLGVKMRHGEKIYRATLESADDTHAQIHIDGSDQGIAPGQFAVFYHDDICLGSGVITDAKTAFADSAIA
ncbi:MAG: tRNA 2-thiouridine(34) synthase MnmA [Candidatus Peregrinibacteria bacterium]|nr:tRNA 2-thiouridine(34) synthase MnmA [Candidatus Peregrinibacteria bacterium]